MLSAQPQSGDQKGAMVASRGTAPNSDLAGSIVRFMAGCGMMKAALPHHLY
jgi:hypothetical protein